MKATTISKALVMLFTIFFVSIVSAQGDALLASLGKDTESPEVKAMITNYHCEVGNQSHCVSKNGIEMMFEKGTLSSINLHSASTAYGTYKDKLPKGLRFGMTPEDVHSALGKPSLSYQSGYSEYEMKNCVLSCWFDGGKLSQLGISTKTTTL